MAEIVYNSSCLAVEEQLSSLADTYRATLICGLWAPAVGRLALVRSSAAIGEPDELTLKHVQGGVKNGEGVATAFERELTEEVGLDPNAISAVYGFATDVPILGGRPRSGKPGKVFGVVCGIVEGRPPALMPQDPDEIASAGWYDLDAAREAFMIQESHPDTAGRGQRNLLVLDMIAQVIPGPTYSGC